MAADEDEEEEFSGDTTVTEAEEPPPTSTPDDPQWEQPPDDGEEKPVSYKTVEFTYHDGSKVVLINVTRTIPKIRGEAKRNGGWYGGTSKSSTCAINLKYVRFIEITEIYDVERKGAEPSRSQDLR
jgi:hypothetical protein